MGLLKETEAKAKGPAAEPGAETAPVTGAAPPSEQGSAAATPEGEGGSDWPEHLPPEQQDEFELALSQLTDVLYKNPQTSKAVLDQIIADEDPAVKTEAAARAATLVITQIDEKIDVSNEVMPYFILATVDAICEMAETKGVEFDEQETEVVLEATAEGVSAALGGGEAAAPGAQPSAAAPPTPGVPNGPQ